MAMQMPSTRKSSAAPGNKSGYQSGVLAGVTALKKYEGSNLFPTLFGISLGTHLFVLGLIALVIFILQFLGLSIPLFEPKAFQQKDIEFTLVDQPNAEKPRDPNTRMRSTQNSRAGGQKVNNRPKAQMIRAAGAPTQKAAAAAQPTPHVAPRKASAAPGPKVPQQKTQQRPQQQQRPQPPAPKRPEPQRPQPKQVTAPQPKRVEQPQPPAPKAPTSNAPPVADVPTPSAPKIRLPGSPSSAKLSAPRAIATGPVAPTYTGGQGGSGSGRSGPVGPSQIPGALSGGGGSGQQGRQGQSGSGGHSGRPGSSGGGGGRGHYEQYGSPGGGGGRDGIDAVAAPDYGAYMSELQRRIKRNWHPPQAQEDKRVVVNFSIDRAGRLLGLSIAKSSGYVEADKAALDAVRFSAPFRNLPPGHKDNDLAIQFTFDYNVFRGAGGFSYH
jgi:TonB family protein